MKKIKDLFKKKTQTEVLDQEANVKTTKSGKIKSAYAAKKGLFSALLIVIVIILLIGVNMASVLIAQKLPTTIDLTANDAFKLTNNNIEYIKQFNNIDKVQKIEIILCATRASYTGTDMINYVYTNQGVTVDSSPDNYFNQTVRLIEEYPKYCSKISVSYIDTQEPSFNKLESETSSQINYGDVVVKTTKSDGSIKTAVLQFNDLYEVQLLEDTAYYYYGIETYQIALSNVENAVSNAMNRTAMGVGKKGVVLTQNCKLTNIAPLLTKLANNDYWFDEYNGIINLEALKNYDVVLIASPTTDFDSASLKVLDQFLENDGKLGKNLIYVASQSSPATPNLNQFLNDWGIKAVDGILYETDSTHHLQGRPTVFAQAYTDNEYSLAYIDTEKIYISGENTPFEIAFETKGSKTVNSLLQTAETVIVAEKGTTSQFTPPSDVVKKSYSTIIMSSDTRYDDQDNKITSAIIAFASEDFVSSIWSDTSLYGNLDYAVQMINVSVGHEDSLYVMPKGTVMSGITATLSEATLKTYTWIFEIILPVLIIAGGIAIWIMRIKK